MDYATDQFIRIEQGADGELTLTSPHTDYTETVNFQPDPTWPSPSEQADMLAAATRRMFGAIYESASGEKLED